MSVPQNKDDLLNAINVNFDKLLNDLRKVPLAIVYDVTMDGHAK